MKAYFLLTLSLLRIYLRDRLTVVMSLALMVFMMTLFGLAMGEEQFRVVLPVAVLDKAATPGAQRVVAALRKDDLLSVVAVDSEAQMQNEIAHAGVIAGLILEPGYGQPGRPPATLMTGRDAGKWQRIGVERLNQLLLATQGRSSNPEWRVDARPIAVAKNRYIDFIFPGMLAMAIMQTCLASGVVLLQAKKNGVLRRLRLDPDQTRRPVYSAASSAPACSLSACTSWRSARSPCSASMPASAATWAELALAIAIRTPPFYFAGHDAGGGGAHARSGQPHRSAVQPADVVLMRDFFKISALPDYLSWLPAVLPLTYLAEMMRGMVNLGKPLSHYVPQLAILGGWFAAALLISLFAARYMPRGES